MNLNKNITLKLSKGNIIIIVIFVLGFAASGIMTFTFGECTKICVIGKYIGFIFALPIALTGAISPPLAGIGFLLLPVYWYLMSLLIIAIFTKIKKFY